MTKRLMHRIDKDVFGDFHAEFITRFGVDLLTDHKVTADQSDGSQKRRTTERCSRSCARTAQVSRLGLKAQRNKGSIHRLYRRQLQLDLRVRSKVAPVAHLNDPTDHGRTRFNDGFAIDFYGF